MQKVIVVLGPTATGKSDLAVQIARKFGGEVISADSRQVYRRLDLGTGKITEKEMAGIPHRLIDIANPKNQFTVADFVKLGHSEIATISERNRLPIICGGTGFYISALLGEVSLSKTPPNPALRKKLAKKSAGELFALLKRLNPERATTIDKNNPRRLIRAIEIAKSKTPLSTSRNSPHYDVLKIGLTLPSKELKKRINARLIARLRKGMVAESADLHKNGLSWKRMDELGLEYRYLSKYIRNQITDAEMIRRLETEIWHYAKRQITWWKRDKTIYWFRPDQLKLIKNKINEFLKF